MVARGWPWGEDVTRGRLKNVFWDDTIVLLIVGLHKSTRVKIHRPVQTKKSTLLYDNLKHKEKKGKKWVEAFSAQLYENNKKSCHKYIITEH